MSMPRASKRVATLAVLAIAAGGLAACSSTSSNTGATTAPTAASSSVKPQSGGTLNIVAASGPDHIDTVPAYYSVDYQLERVYTRQLVSYPTVPAPTTTGAGWTTDTTPVADAATEVPTAANGGISGGGTVYTFHIKPGVDWDTTPARQVTSQDFLREFKAFFNPVSPVGNAVYYTSTIKGFAAYDTAETNYFANAKAHPPTAANIAAFQNSHSIAGISTPNSSTIQFTLMAPASDFIYMMAMPFASARPVEYDKYVPDSIQLDENTISDGPYQISSYIAGKSITFVRNPAWKQQTDTLRHDYPASIVETLGVTSAQTQLADIQAGSQDLTSGDTPVNPSSVPGLAASKISNFNIWPWSDTFPYLIFNLRSPNAGGAMQNLDVRQAVEYGIDKIAVVKAMGGPLVGSVINTVIPPGNAGYVNYNLYLDDNGAGNVAACKSKLAAGGHPNGITLSYMYPNDSTNTRVFQSIQASLALCGITLDGKGEPGSSFFTDLGNAPENNKAGTWDMGQPGWIPDWFGNNGRTVIQALFQGPNCVINTVNYGCYDESSVNTLITQAEGASTLTAAAADWHSADEDIMKDAAIVPIMSQTFPLIASTRVRSVLPNGSTYPTAMFNTNISDSDIANVWLAS
jgi:peptide/nickel transport system substrate-binding protein